MWGVKLRRQAGRDDVCPANGAPLSSCSELPACAAGVQCACRVPATLRAPCQAVTLYLTESFHLPFLTDSTRFADRERLENKLKVTEVGAPTLRSQSGTLQGLYSQAALRSAVKDSPGELLSRNNEVGRVGPEYLRHDSTLKKTLKATDYGMGSRFGKGLGRSSERYAWSCYMQSHCEACTRRNESGYACRRYIAAVFTTVRMVPT